ncbi:protein disulfide-isomerase A2 [Podarcis muralis]
MGCLPRLLLALGLAVALVHRLGAQESRNQAEEEEEEEDQGVLVLNQSNFAQALRKHKLLLVEFYAPWSSHCQALAPEYAKAAALLKEEGSALRLAKVDGEQEKELSAEFGVSGFPVLKLFRDGNRTHPADFTGQRDAEGIVKWLKRKAGPSAVLLENASQAAAFLDANMVAVVGFFPDLQDEDVRLFYDVASDAPDVAFALTNCSELFEKFNVTHPGTVSLFRKHDESREDFLVDEELGLDGAELAQFILVQSLELVMEYTSQNSSRIFGAKIPNHLLLFINKTQDSQLELLSSFRDAAPAFRGQVLFVLADVNGEGAQILHFFGLKSPEAPAIRFINIESNRKYLLGADGSLTAPAIHAFCQEVMEGKVQPYLMSEEIAEDWDKAPVKTLVGRNFDQVAFDESKSVFVKFYAPWCPHSKAMAPAWAELGEKYKDREDVLIAEMDATANEVAGLPIRAYPTLYYFPAGQDKKMIEYQSARDLESFSAFLENGGEVPPQDDTKAAETPEEPQENRTSPPGSPEPRDEL